MNLRTCISCCALLLLAGCGGGRQAGNVKLTYSVFFPPTHPQAKLAQAWAEEVAKATAGRVKVTVFAGGALTKADQCYEGVVDGISDIGMSALAYTRGRFPLMEVLDLPVGSPDGRTATRIANELYRKYQPKELAATHLLYLHAHGPGILAAKRPVKTLADIRGLKIRATGFSAKVVECLGASPIGMPQGDTYEALQKGVVEATFCPMETLQGWKQGEVISDVTDLSCIGYTTTFFVTVNQEAWDSILPADRAAIESISARWSEKHGEAWDRADLRALDFIKQLGRQVYVPPPAERPGWVKAVEPVFADYVKRAGAKGLPGREILADLRGHLDAARKDAR